MKILLALNIGAFLALLGALYWQRLERAMDTPVDHFNTEGLKEYRTRTGVLIYCIRGGKAPPMAEGLTALLEEVHGWEPMSIVEDDNGTVS